MDAKTAAWLVAREHPYGLSKFRLLKLLWLADLRSIEQRGRPLTDAGWIRWRYGPFSKKIIREVEASDLFSIQKEERQEGEMHRIRVVKEDPAVLDTDPVEREILARVLVGWLRVPDQAVKEDVYADPFFESVPQREAYDFSRLHKFRETSWTNDEITRLLSEPRKPYRGIASLVG